MMLVACDICGRRYSLAEERLGQRLTCKSCDVEFEVCRGNEVDPEEPEFPVESPVENDDPDVEWTQLLKRTVGGICVVIGLGAMISLLFIDPRSGQAQAPIAAGNQPRLPAVINPPLAVNRPVFAPSPPQNFDITPPDPVMAAAPARLGNSNATPVTEPDPEDPFVVVDEPLVKPHFPSVPRGDIQDQMREAQERMAKQLEELNRQRPNITPPTRPAFPTRPGAVPQAQTRFGGINYDGPGSIPSSNRPVQRIQDLTVKQIVQVKWGNSWWPADVLELQGNDMVRVQYRGWSQTESVELKRVQLPHQ